ncbi:MAG TPA: EAL domain-containing protein [Usitatibacter sp.]|jgi:diguanylate cyclase (GGDEF)-like protein/PAS domain S-box-containing protein|nr:EAL domain-containing protein [Usitatibacter sp.]
MPRSRPAAIVWLFAGIVICLLGLTVYSARLLASGQAFISAEGAWAKAQKDAVFYLSRYAEDGAEDDYRAYRAAIRVIEGDRAARVALTQPRPDIDAVRRGLLQGGVREEDVPGLLELYRLLRGFGPMEYLISVWARSDAFIGELEAIGGALHQRGGARDRGEAQDIARRIHRINRALAPLENDFSQTLEEMQRAAQSLLTTAILVITGLLLIAGITASRRFLAQNARLQEALVESEAQLRRVIEAAPMPLLIARASDQRLLYLNGKALEQLGLDFASAVERPFADFHADPAIRAALGEQLARQGVVDDFEVHLRSAGGRESWLLLSARRVPYGGTECLLIALANIDDRKRVQEDMRRRALHDPLTGLANRAMFLESLERAMHKARRRSAQFSLLFVDLDRFKEVNDTMGHAAGDALLKAVTERLVMAVRQSDLVARLGGDEFVILIEEHEGPEEVMIVAQKVLSMVARPVPVDWREAAVSASIGIASFPEDGEDIEALMRNADTAMYQAKERGRNNFQFYSPELNVISHRRLALERRVREALEREELFIEYQPEVDLASGRIVAAEALLRWNDPQGGVSTPPEFMPVAEETGIAPAIGAWVLERVLSDARAWHERGVPLAVGVNLSARQLQQPDLAEQVGRALEAHRMPAAMLRLEIAEPVLMEGEDAAHRTLRGLEALGVQMAIDNFGSGFSSLGLVRGLPFGVVKIDRSLVSSCPVRRECAAIVQATTAMAHALGLRVVAQGVESEEQRAQMAALGCDAAQGHYFAEPMQAGAIPELLRRREPGSVSPRPGEKVL